MDNVIDSPLVVGGWVLHAQAALDELAEMSTIDEVARRFGTARRLCEVILGFPLSGGHATRRVVRCVGRLLYHRLGPAVAAEVLSWAASAAIVVDTAAIEALVESAEDAPVACRPLRLDDRWDLQDCLRRVVPMAARRRVLLAMFADRPGRLVDPDLAFDWLGQGRFSDWVGVEWDPPEWEETEIAVWLQWLVEPGIVGAGIVERVAAAGSTEAQIGLVATAGLCEVGQLARSEVVFDLDEAIVARCLLDATADLLSNRLCPADLSERVRYPYDMATVELAVRAGDRHFDRLRLRRLLTRLGADAWAYLLGRAPERFLVALRRCDLVSAAELSTGRLAGVDLSDARTAAAVFGTPNTWKASTVPDALVEVLKCHRQADGLVWLVDSAWPGALTGEHARELIEEGSPVVARSALRHLPVGDLTARDAAVAAARGGLWAAACPAVPACRRPPRGEREVDFDTAVAAGSFEYPDRVAALIEESFDEAPGWTVELPETPAEVLRNARLMRNCTAGYVDAIECGSGYLVIVTDPQQRRFNVGLARDGQRFVVSEINSWANGGIRPDWIRSAFQRRLDRAPTRPVVGDDTPVQVRRLSDRRDRRRARSRAARRLKR